MVVSRDKLTTIFNQLPELQLDRAIHISRQHSYIYIQVPKAACSTIKANLYQIEAQSLNFPLKEQRYIHDKRSSLLLSASDIGYEKLFDLLEDSKIFKFCLVRNPYTRVLSAFLNKILLYSRTRKKCLTELEDRETESLSFIQFLRQIRGQSSLEMNLHWRPQTDLLFWSHIDYQFVGHLENFKGDFEEVIQKIFSQAATAIPTIPIQKRAPHATHASSQLSKFYTPEAIDLVREIYREDFLNFNYSLELPADKPKKTEISPSESKFIPQQPAEISWETHQNQADIFLEIGKLKSARRSYLKAIELQPDIAQLHRSLATVYEKLGQKERAIAALRRTTELQPDFWEADRDLAQLLVAQSQYSQAVESYRKAIRTNPDSAELYVDLGHALRYQGLTSEALDCYHRAIELEPTAKRAYTALQYTPNTESVDRAIALYRQVLQTKPRYAPVWENLADALTKQGKIDEAIDCYRQSCYYYLKRSNLKIKKRDWLASPPSPPNFLIIGATKCGTSSLHAYLKSHPQILLSFKKELQFFSRNFDLGLDWYLAHFPPICDRPEFITGEASPGYFHINDTDRHLFESFPNMKLVLLLRNPVDRAYSEYYQHCKVGRTPEETFATIVRDEIQTVERSSTAELEDLVGFAITSLYAYKIERWLRLFPREQFLIIQSETLFRQPSQVMAQVYEFLGVSNIERAYYRASNAGSYPPMDDETRQILKDFFRPHNQRLEEILGQTFDWD